MEIIAVIIVVLKLALCGNPQIPPIVEQEVPLDVHSHERLVTNGGD